MTGLAKKKIADALEALKEHYENEDSSLSLFHENGEWKLNVKEDYTDIVRNVVSEAEMAVPIMETLAVIAYKSPILQSDVIKMRGSGAYDHIKLLEEKGFISKEKLGRSYKIKVVEKFFEYFDINGESKIDELFKDVKKPNPETLGNLKVYNSNESGNDNKFNQQISDRMQKLDITPEEEETKDKFLEDFDDKLEQSKDRIDKAEKELSEYQREEPEETILDEDTPSESHKPDGIFEKDKEEPAQEKKEEDSEEDSEDETDTDEDDSKEEPKEDKSDIFDDEKDEEKVSEEDSEDVLKKVNKQIDNITKEND